MSTPQKLLGQRPGESLEEAVIRSAAVNPALGGDVDAALVMAARMLARQIDQVMALQEVGAITHDQTTRSLYLLPHLMNILKEMLATPATRAAQKDQEKDFNGGKLEHLRAAG